MPMAYTTRVDGMAEDGCWILRPGKGVWPMRSAARLVPLSITGVPIAETVVNGTRTEEVNKIAERIPTSASSPSSQSLHSAVNGGRTDGRRRMGAIRETRPFPCLGSRVDSQPQARK